MNIQFVLNGKWILVESADVRESDNYYVEGIIPLSILTGSISQMSIVMVVASQLMVSNLLPVILEWIQISLKIPNDYSVYTIGTLDTKNVTLLPSLTPKSFQFNVYHSKSSTM